MEVRMLFSRRDCSQWRKIKLLGNMRMVHLAEFCIYLFTLTPSADVQGPWLPSIFPILNVNPETAIKVNNRNARKTCEIFSKLL